MKKRMTIMLIAVGLLIGGLVGFNFFKGYMMQKYMGKGGLPPATVSAMKAEYQVWQPQLNAVGTLRAVRGVDVTTEVAGLVRSINFKSGDEVKAGQVLAQLNADSDIAQLHSLEAAAELASTVYERDKAQLAAEVISKAQVDTDAGDLKSKRAQVAQQQAVVEKKTLRAPFAGKLGISIVNPGQYLNPADKLVTLQTIDPIYVDFYLPQQQLPQVAIGQTVTLTTDTYKDVPFTGKINAINPKIDTNTRNVQVEATIPNTKRQLLARDVRQCPGELGRGKSLYHASPDRNHLQSLRRHGIRGEAIGQEGRQGRKGQRALARAAGVRHHRPDARRSGSHPERHRARHRGGDQRPGQAQERHAADRGQQGAAIEQPQPEAAGTMSQRT